uniref:Chitin-binding type-4 domain-containing protein n=1 Tax=Odontella aurita TaxID=265563 RepID=A0A7S4M6J5_9STRA|mmetsp:Transcript_12486/g.36831  ORF Transcript_12486/g.36831 Transcript_12486/m.36831 type:complete len:672 (+) Transcript_12486:581-2596(+)
MSRFASSLLSALLLLAGSSFRGGPGPTSVDAHGHMTSPRSRNWVAAEDGVNGWGDDSARAGVPPKESCPHCLNNNLGVCGKVANGGRSYDPFLDSTGQPMPWQSQDTFAEGAIIVVKSYLDTHHNGHMTLSACADGPNSTQACFDRPENFLTFVADPKFGMLADPNYPERGMYYGGQGGGEKSFEMIFQLPEGVGIHGDEVMLQWRYITANSCSPPGYAEYFSTNNLPNSFWTSGLTQCTPPYPSDGTRSTTWPEQFFNCAEISVNAAAPTPAPPPTASTPTVASPTSPVASPVASPPTATTGGPACCTRDFKKCNEQLVGWCSENQGNCEGACGKFWLPTGAITSDCTARYEPCSSDTDCCSPGVCKSGMCELGDYGPTSPTSPTAPTPTSPTAPSPSPPDTNPACCTQRFHECVSWCGTTESECVNCGQEVYWAELQQGNCLAKDDPCLNNPDGCCMGLVCSGNEYHKQCIIDTSAPTAAPPTAPPPTTTTTTTASQPTTTTTTAIIANSCYSFNYKDCNHPDVPSDGSCTPVFLPNGANENCLALWDECTGQSDDACCHDLVCYGNTDYAQCIETAKVPARRMLATSTGQSNASSRVCTVCDNVSTRDMTENGVDCISFDNLEAMCTKDGNWLMNRFCRQSCFNAGYGYEGDSCCAESSASRLLRKKI